MGRASAKLAATHMSSDGNPRMGSGLLLQSALGLRPSEMLALRPEDVEFAATSLITSDPTAMIRLGTGVGTKIKREQFSILRSSRHPEVFEHRKDVVAHTPAGHRMFPYSIGHVRTAIIAIESRLGLRLGWGARSPRSGWRRAAFGLTGRGGSMTV